MTARRRIERSNKSVPTFGIGREDPAISQSLFGFAKRGVEY